MVEVPTAAPSLLPDVEPAQNVLRRMERMVVPFLVVGLVAVVVVGIAYLLPWDGFRNLALAAAGLAMFGFTVTLMVYRFKLTDSKRQESRAGYSTLDRSNPLSTWAGSFPDRRLWGLNPDTGAVTRRPRP